MEGILRRWLGVEHVFLTDNAQGDEVVMGSQLQDFVDEGFLTFTHEPASRLLVLVRWRCLQAARKRGVNWLANIDLDEYIVLRDGCGRRPCRAQASVAHVGTVQRATHQVCVSYIGVWVPISAVRPAKDTTGVAVQQQTSWR